MASRPQLRPVKREKEANTREKYAEMYDRYVKYEFTYDAHCLIQKLTEKGKCEPHMEGVELYRILIEISKLLFLNELEILFLGATLQEIKWKVIDPCLNTYMEGFKGLQDRLKSDNYGRKMQLSLLLIGYIVKLYLNEEIQLFEFRIRELVTKDYDKMYQEWVEKMKKNFKFNPKNMNKLFKELDIIRAKKSMELDELNYNQKVTELFEKYVGEMKDEYSREQTPIEEEEVEGEPNVPQSILRGASMQSVHSLTQRESFRELLNRGDSMLMRNNYSLLRNNSLEEDE